MYPVVSIAGRSESHAAAPAAGSTRSPPAQSAVVNALPSALRVPNTLTHFNLPEYAPPAAPCALNGVKGVPSRFTDAIVVPVAVGAVANALLGFQPSQ